MTHPDLQEAIAFHEAIVAEGSKALIGYDSRRGSLLVRDPYQRYLGEFIAGDTLERYRSTGPRGLALVPLDPEKGPEKGPPACHAAAEVAGVFWWIRRATISPQ